MRDLISLWLTSWCNIFRSLREARFAEIVAGVVQIRDKVDQAVASSKLRSSRN